MQQEQNIEFSPGTLDDVQAESWLKPVVCRVEVDLPGWVAQLTGKKSWQVLSEDETEEYVTYAMRSGKKEAEVTLYHSGYAMVDVDGQSLFDGPLTNGQSAHTHLSYFNLEDGEPITLN
jgi:hypothetical protein